MKPFAALTLLLLAAGVYAQTPDAAFRLDIRNSFSVSEQNQQRVRWYDRRGRYSLVEMLLVLETGNFVRVAQRLQTIDGAADQENLNEYYIEDRGRWRIGKQYLPFGRRSLVQESALALRYDSELLIFDLPFTVAYADAGAGRQRGVVARVGDLLAASVAVGDNFGIGAQSLTQFRRPEESPGTGRGYRLVLGVDFAYPLGNAWLRAEGALFRDGASPLDEDREVTDLTYGFIPKGTNYQFDIGWSRDWTNAESYYRIEGILPYSQDVTIEPFIRFEGTRWVDAAVTARLRF
jgi:hypothetical protein